MVRRVVTGRTPATRTLFSPTAQYICMSDFVSSLLTIYSTAKDAGHSLGRPARCGSDGGGQDSGTPAGPDDRHDSAASPRCRYADGAVTFPWVALSHSGPVV